MKLARLVGRLARPAKGQVGGYTIVEIMMFLAVSAAIFAAAQFVFSGQQGRTQFEQGVHDEVSSIQQAVDQISTGIFPGQSGYSCASSGTPPRAVLSIGSGDSSACIFLGFAFQVLPGQGGYYNYTVLGNRLDSNNNEVTSLSSANPEPVVNSGPSKITLTSQFPTNWGTVVSSKVDYQSGGSANSDLVGFYNNLGSGSASGSQSTTAKGYSFTSSNLSSVNSSALTSCLEESTASCANTQLISDWKLCLASAGSSQTALLTFTSTPAGMTSDINFTSCS